MQAVAFVNGSPITVDAYKRNTNILLKRYMLMFPYTSLDQQDYQQSEQASLNHLINRELLYQECQRLNLPITEDMIEDKLNQVKSRLGSEQEYQNFLNASTMSEADFIEDIKRDLAVKVIVANVLRPKIEVTDQELRELYEKKKNIPAMVRASHIVIVVKEDEDEQSRKKKRELMEEIHKKLIEGADFAEMARMYSQDPSRKNGGDVGYFAPGEMVKPFEQVAYSLNVGETSDVFETRYGYHILKVTDRKEPRTATFDELKKSLEEQIKNRKVNQLLAQTIDRLRASAQIKVHKDLASLVNKQAQQQQSPQEGSIDPY